MAHQIKITHKYRLLTVATVFLFFLLMFTLPVVAEAQTQAGSTWLVEETCPDQKWVGTWTRRPGTETFDAIWKKTSGEQSGTEVRDVIDFKGVANGKVSLYRHGNSGTYTGKLSSNGRKVKNGDATWYNNGCYWKAKINRKKGPRPFQYNPKVNVGAPDIRQGGSAR